MSDEQSMVERVARALQRSFDEAYRREWEYPPRLWEEELEDIRFDYLREARAAIDAMRDCTIAMMLALDAKIDPYKDVRQAVDGWNAAIDAALAEPQS